MADSKQQSRHHAAEDRPVQQDPAEGARDTVERELKRQEETEDAAKTAPGDRARHQPRSK